MKLLPTHLATLGAIGISSIALNAHAGGFALIEQGASGLGNAYAGAGAVAHDPSTVWFNPAGITELTGRQLTVAAHLISADTKFTDQGTSLNQAFIAPISGPDTAEPGGVTPVPNFYYLAPINDKLSYGLGISVPFGSSTEYDRDWKGRYTTVKSGVSVIDINPVIAYRVSDKVRIGGGISVQQLSAELENAVDSGVVCGGTVVPATGDQLACATPGLLPGILANDGYAAIDGSSTAVTFNIGALFFPKPETRIGVAYRHGITHDLDGDVDFTNNETLEGLLAANSLPFLQDSGVSGEIELPASLSFSIAHELNDQVQLLGDATWAGWSSFQELAIEFDSPQPESVGLQDWEDVWRISAGVNYQLNEKVILRAGLAYDQEPIPSPQRRTGRIPGNDRTWFAVGAGYKLNKNASLDFGFTHLSLDESAVDNKNENREGETNGASILRGTYDNSVNIVSAQFNWKFN